MNRIIYYAALMLASTSVSYGWCDSRNPYGEKPKEYLSGNDYILYAVKVSGVPALAEFAEYFDGRLSNEVIGERWSILAKDVEEQFYVVKSIKGSAFNAGDLIVIENKYREYMGTSTGHDYVLFINSEDGHLYYDRCNFASFRGFSMEKKNKLLSEPTNILVSRLIDSHLMACLEKELP